MAVLDPRLLELIETLAAARLDWLAFELIDGIQAGRRKQESEEDLEAVRSAVRGKDQPKPTGEPRVVSADATPIEGDDQVAWAAVFVAERLDATLAQLDEAITALDVIVKGEEGAAIPTKGIVDVEPVVVLSDGDFPRMSRRQDVAEARAFIPKLRASLDEWSVRVRVQIQP